MYKFSLFRSSLAALCLSAAVLSTPVAAQQPGDVRSQLKVADSAHLQILTLRDGSTIVGRITAIGQDSLTLSSSMGVLSLPIANISRVQEIDADRMNKGVYWFPNPNSTRLFFAPTGRMLKRGEGYVCDYETFFHGGACGVTDDISTGVGGRGSNGGTAPARAGAGSSQATNHETNGEAGTLK